MNIFGHDSSFWVAVIGATVFRIVTSQKEGWKQVLITGSTALFVAWAATDAVLDFWDWDPDKYKTLTAGMIVLVGENIMRTLVTMDLERLVKLYKDIRK